MTEYRVSETYATVGAREDIDGMMRTVVVDTNRTKGDDEATVIIMTPRVARSLARRLAKWARYVDPPKVKK